MIWIVIIVTDLCDAEEWNRAISLKLMEFSILIDANNDLLSSIFGVW